MAEAKRIAVMLLGLLHVHDLAEDSAARWRAKGDDGVVLRATIRPLHCWREGILQEEFGSR